MDGRFYHNQSNHMKNPEQVHVLADVDQKCGMIEFIHTDGTKHKYTSCVNRITGDRMSYMDNNPPTLNHSLGEVRKIFANIRKNASSIISSIGDF